MQAVDPGERRFGHDVLARRGRAGHRAGLLDQAGQDAAGDRRGVGARCRAALALSAALGRGLLVAWLVAASAQLRWRGRRGLLLGRIAAEQLLHRGRLAGAGRCLTLHAQPAEHAVHGGKRLLQRAGLVGDAELEEGAPLDDRLGARGIGDAGQLDHDAVVARLLHQGLLDAELVDPLPEDRQRQIQVALGIGGDLLRLVELERQVHAALEVEAPLERDAGHGGVAHDAVGAALAQRRPSGGTGSRSSR